MGPDLYWVAILALGGLAMGLVTSFIGLPKGREFVGWLLLYAFMVTVIVLVDAEAPFWTVLAASIAANITAGLAQVALLPSYRRKNPWFAEELAKPGRNVIAGLIGFSLFAGSLFGIMAATCAWALSLL